MYYILYFYNTLKQFSDFVTTKKISKNELKNITDDMTKSGITITNKKAFRSVKDLLKYLHH